MTTAKRGTGRAKRSVNRLAKALHALQSTVHSATQTEKLVRQTRQRQVLAAGHQLGQRYGDNWPDLTRFELSVYSQNGEDGVLQEIFHRMGLTNGYFVEIGAHASQANCIMLAHYCGWSGTFIDAGQAESSRMRSLFRNTPTVGVVGKMVSPGNIDAILNEVIGQDLGLIDLLSIDVDGIDYWLWEATEAKPKVVVIEYNSSIPAKLALAQPLDAPPWDGSDFGGASIGAMVALGQKKGYSLVHCESAGVNAFFVRNDFAQLFDTNSVILRGPNYNHAAVFRPSSNSQGSYVDVSPNFP